MNDYAAKFATAEECVAELRERAVGTARGFLEVQAKVAEGKMRPIDLARLDARLNDWCTAIEVLTVNGTYFAERTSALNEARRREASK